MNCKFIKSDGKQCQAFAIKGSEYCLPHSKHVLKLESSMNSTNSTNSTNLTNSTNSINIKSIDDLPDFLINTISNVHDGLLQARIGSVIGYLTSVLLRSYELSDLQKRIIRLEEVIHAHFVEIKDLECTPE